MESQNINTVVLTEEQYVKPAIEVIEIENEGVLASSAGGFGDGGGYIDPGW